MRRTRLLAAAVLLCCAALFAARPVQAADNTIKIAEKCDIEFTLGKGIFPVYPIPEGATDDEPPPRKKEGRR